MFIPRLPSLLSW